MRVEVDRLVEVLRLGTRELFDYLKRSSYAVAGSDYVLWWRGEGLACLVAHIDHVYEESEEWLRRPIFYDGERLSSMLGIAGDDRAGVYAVMRLFEELEVNALFTDGEERGGIGAREACSEERLFSVPYFIEIDRRGIGEAVFYNCEERLVPDFVRVINKYFKVCRGTFSDISILGRYFGVASVNLSAGFFNEHRGREEYIYLPGLEYTLIVVPRVLRELGDVRYELEGGLWGEGEFDRFFEGGLDKKERSSYIIKKGVEGWWV
jgi:hypothetical protein